jgi:hypothetical protein
LVLTNIDVFVGIALGVTIRFGFESSAALGTFVVSSTADGFLTLDYAVTGVGANVGALSFISLMSFPEPSVYALLAGLLGLSCVIVCRRI